MRTLLILAFLLVPSLAFASHPPGQRTWCAITNGGDVTAVCTKKRH